MTIHDTIVAIATPLAPSGIGVIRVSGPQADAILRQVTGSRSLPRYRELRLRRLTDPQTGCTLDRALVVRFPAHASFTGEATVEFPTHGSPAVVRAVLDACVRLGARQAEPGEFTRQALMNGRLDLAQAEAIADLAQAWTDNARRLALRQLEGDLPIRIADMRDRLLTLVAAYEASFDFDDDLHPEEAPDVHTADTLTDELTSWVRDAQASRLLRDGAEVVIAGAPNTGKSSLLNALLSHERAIVSPVAGTTRDAVSESLEWDGYAIRLTDTAGWRTAGDMLEALGIEHTRRCIDRADILIWLCAPGLTAMPDPDWIDHSTAVLYIWNKDDIAPPDQPDRFHLQISAKHGHGMPSLRTLVTDRLRDLSPSGLPLLTTPRQAAVASRALCLLQEAQMAAAHAMPAEIIASLLREAWRTLGEITGETADAAVIDTVFDRFCVGK